MVAKHGPQGDGYPDVCNGMQLIKSVTCDSGYKGISVSRTGSTLCFQARDGARSLGLFPTRTEAAAAFARSRET
jgi:hypothetical protein